MPGPHSSQTLLNLGDLGIRTECTGSVHSCTLPGKLAGPDMIHREGILASAKPNANDFQSPALGPTKNSAEPGAGQS